MPKGNPNPSPATRFKKGQSGNPGGITSNVKAMALANAEAAIRIRERVLRAAEARLNELSSEEVLAEYVEAAMLKLLTDSETRGLGAPVSSVDLSSKDGSMTPQIIERIIVKATDQNA